MKTCFRCKQTKSFDLFFKHKQTSDGYHSWCKICFTEGNEKSRRKQKSTIEGRAKIFLRHAKNRAAKRKQDFLLTNQGIVDCWNKQLGFCAYSGRAMTLEAGKLNTVSIERINSNIGYTVENTVLVCQAINRMKSDFGFEDFFGLCRDVSSFLGDDEHELAVGAYK
jgi:hypothetical protein